eukprot:Skav205649  [mRNA]  locus=scaffold458:138969:144051:+ [translate_table: standard]
MAMACYGGHAWVPWEKCTLQVFMSSRDGAAVLLLTGVQKVCCAVASSLLVAALLVAHAESWTGVIPARVRTWPPTAPVTAPVVRPVAGRGAGGAAGGGSGAGTRAGPGARTAECTREARDDPKTCARLSWEQKDMSPPSEEDGGNFTLLIARGHLNEHLTKWRQPTNIKVVQDGPPHAPSFKAMLSFQARLRMGNLPVEVIMSQVVAGWFVEVAFVKGQWFNETTLALDRARDRSDGWMRVGSHELLAVCRSGFTAPEPSKSSRRSGHQWSMFRCFWAPKALRQEQEASDKRAGLEGAKFRGPGEHWAAVTRRGSPGGHKVCRKLFARGLLPKYKRNSTKGTCGAYCLSTRASFIDAGKQTELCKRMRHTKPLSPNI